MKLDKEEAEILNAYDQGKMNLSAPTKAEKAKIKTAAENTFRKNRRVTIRLYDHDLTRKPELKKVALFLRAGVE